MKNASRLQAAGLVAVSVLLALVVGEAALRLLGPDLDPSPEWHFEPRLGWVQNPGHRYAYVVAGDEVEVAYNASGFRDVEHAVPKPPGVKRIVVLGDSFSAAVEVNLRDTFARRLEEILNARGRDRWEVINLGVGDFGTAQELLALERYGLAYQPDAVVHQIFPLNDICNNSLDLAGLCKSTKDDYRPYFVAEGGGLRPASPQPLRNLLRRHLEVYRLAEKAYLRIAGREGSQVDEDEYRRRLSAAGLPELVPLLDTFVRDEDQIEPVARGWTVTERLVERIAGRCRELGIRYVPVVIPFEARLAGVWPRFAASQPPPAMIRDYPEKRFGELFERLGVEGVLLLDLFDENADAVLPTRGGHLNPAAHGLVARALAARFGDGGEPSEDFSSGAGEAELAWGSAIELGRAEARAFLREGWGAPEGTHVWTVGGRAVFAARTPPSPGGLRLRASVHAFLVPGAIEQQIVRIAVNGEPAGGWTVTVPGLHEETLLIPADLVAGRRRIEIHFETPGAASPASQGISPDERTLAIAFASLTLSEESG